MVTLDPKSSVVTVVEDRPPVRSMRYFYCSASHIILGREGDEGNPCQMCIRKEPPNVHPDNLEEVRAALAKATEGRE